MENLIRKKEPKRSISAFFHNKVAVYSDEIQTLAIWTDSMCGLHNENTLSHTNYLPFALAERGSGYDNFVIFR